MKRAVFLVTLLTAAVAITVPAFAGTQDNAVLALEVRPHATKSSLVCFKTGGSSSLDPVTGNRACNTFTTTGALNIARDMYLVVAKADNVAGIAGVSLGIQYDGVASSGIDVFGWSLCSDLDFPNGSWPNSGGGTRITWSAGTNCQRTVLGTMGAHAVAGAFYVYAYSSDTFKITENKGLAIPELRVADCNASESNINQAKGVGSAGFGANAGCNPCLTDCGIIPVEPTTWGKIKNFGTN